MCASAGVASAFLIYASVFAYEVGGDYEAVSEGEYCPGHTLRHV